MAIVVIFLMIFVPFLVKAINNAIPFENIYNKIFPNFWTMHSVSQNGGAVAPLVLLVALILVSFLIVMIYKSLNIKERIYHTWACGYNTNSKSQYSATGFAGPIRRFFNWLYRPEVHTYTQTLAGHKTKFSSSLYEVHVKPLFEKSLYEGTKKLVNLISYYIYKISHFEKTRYEAFIFIFLVLVLFSFRVFYKEINLGSILLEIVVVIIFLKVLLIGDKNA